ncbi:MAG: hypothetical protein IT452_13735 [Planctomycetia bacterium]|nr:hypothetical protein [Planctomycetia bacterium]
MALPLELLQKVQRESPPDAWKAILHYAWLVCSAAMKPERAAAESQRRDAEIGDVDLFLATAGWDLWRAYAGGVPKTSRVLTEWWRGRPAGRAVLILDALSLREAPWILQGAKERGYTIHEARATGAELPADTTPFAEALGFGTRASLQNNGAGGSHHLRGATTDSNNHPWADCASRIKAEPDWVLWHHWPDHRLHELSEPGEGFQTLSKEIAKNLTSDEFWNLVDRLSTGRRVVITADHGYAYSGNFPDIADGPQAQHLKQRFKSGRWVPASDASAEPSSWVPPLDLRLPTGTDESWFVLGRRRWKSQGGYPALTHGGLSVLEVAVPFIEISRGGGA